MNYIGIDGGGTKTSFILFNENGEKIKQVIKPSIHILNQSEDNILNYLKDGCDELDPSRDAIISIGLAGYGKVKKLREKIERLCEQSFHDRTYYLFSDIEIAMAGALDNKDGVVVIAGTGSIALSKNDNTYKRVGGWGYQLGDEGSAYYIANEIFRTYCKQCDGRLNKTRLYTLVKEKCELNDDYDLISFVSNLNHDRTKIASYAKLNYELALQNDKYALNIYEDCALKLYELIKPLINDFDKFINVSYIGGVFQSGQYILKPLNDLLKNENVKVIKPIHSPEYGAYILAKEKSNYE